jgi:hypothetical protein
MTTDDASGEFVLTSRALLRHLWDYVVRYGPKLPPGNDGHDRAEHVFLEVADQRPREPHYPSFGHIGDDPVIGGITYTVRAVSVDYRMARNERTMLPYSFEVKATGGDLPYPVTLIVRDRADGHGYVVTDLLVQADPALEADAVQVGRLRRLNLETLRRDAVRAVGTWNPPAEPDETFGDSLSVPGWYLPAEAPDAEWQADVDEADRLTGRRPISEAYLEELAEVYRQAVADGKHPSQVVRAHFNLGAMSTAYKHVQRAREAGFLGEVVSTSPYGTEGATRPSRASIKTEGKK